MQNKARLRSANYLLVRHRLPVSATEHTFSQYRINFLGQDELPLEIQLAEEHVASSADIIFGWIRNRCPVHWHTFIVDYGDEAGLSNAITLDCDYTAVHVGEITLKA